MRYRLLGRSGRRVSELCLGTMTFGAAGWGTEEDEAARMVGRFRDAGGNFFDTANEIYGGGRSEEMLGRLVARERDAVVIAGKGHEDYQIIGNRVCAFDDRSVSRELILQLTPPKEPRQQ